MPPKIVLAADTGTRHCSVAVCRFDDAHGDATCAMPAEAILDHHQLHAESLMAVADWILKRAGVSLGDLTHLAVGIGPGSFTGLRVGAAAWKGLAFALRLPLVPVPSLDAMTRINAMYDGVMMPLLDARMGEVFGAAYRFAGGKREKVTPDLVCPVERLLEAEYVRMRPLLLLGSGADRYHDFIVERAPHALFASAVNNSPRASAVAMEACDLLMRGGDFDPARVAPVYLRASQAEQARAAASSAQPTR